MRRYVISNFLGLVGAVVGGVAGFFTYRWVLSKGFVGGMIPGAFVGLGCSLLARHQSFVRGVICGVAGLGLGFFTDWYTNDTDDTFGVYLQNIKNINQVILLTIVIGTVIAFWLGKDAGLAGRSWPGPGAGKPEPPQELPKGV
jgi:hypothetical protein